MLKRDYLLGSCLRLMDCAACQILDRYARTGLFMQPVECVFCQNIIDNETESDREQENVRQNDQDIVSQSLPPEMEAIMNEGTVLICKQRVNRLYRRVSQSCNLYVQP